MSLYSDGFDVVVATSVAGNGLGIVGSFNNAVLNKIFEQPWRPSRHLVSGKNRLWGGCAVEYEGGDFMHGQCPIGEDTFPRSPVALPFCS